MSNTLVTDAPTTYPFMRTSGLYGPRGWTVSIGLWPCLQRLRHSQGDILELDQWGGPRTDYVGFSGMDSDMAAHLLHAMSSPLLSAALNDRQNNSPSLKRLLEVCARSGDEVMLCGYGIGPQRHDERLSVDALWVRDTQDTPAEHRESSGPLARLRVWESLNERLGLDAHSAPDDMSRTSPQWGGSDRGWWLWWD